METRCYTLPSGVEPLKNPVDMSIAELVDGLSRLRNNNADVAKSLIRYYDSQYTLTERQVKLAQRLLTPMYEALEHMQKVGRTHQWRKVSEVYHYTNTALRTSASTATLRCTECGEEMEDYINKNYSND